MVGFFLVFSNISQAFSMSLSVVAGFTSLTFVLHCLPLDVTTSGVHLLITFSPLGT